MKKSIVLFSIFLFFVSLPVFAIHNQLVLEEEEGLYTYHEQYLLDEDLTQEIQMNHLEKYTREIGIQNNSDLKKEIFLLFESKAEDGSYNDLMEYLTLTIKMDDKVVYDGSAETQDLATKREDLHDFISLGKMKEKGNATLTIEMSLSEEYKSVSDNQFAYVHWSFYQKDADKDFVGIEKVAPTSFYNFLDVWVFCGVCILFAVLLLSIFYFKSKRKTKNDDEKEKKEEEKETEKEEKK